MIYKYWVITNDQDYGSIYTHSAREANNVLVDGKRLGLYRMDAVLIEVLEELVEDKDIISID
jgi:hypothetical protein